MNGRSVPQVSVTMAVYNGQGFLRLALDSLLAQTLRDFELIAVDDGSEDDTAATLAEYEARDRRVRVLRNPQNMGLVHTRNRALTECRAPLMAIADADDLFMPDRLACQVEFMKHHPEVGFVGSNARLIDGTGQSIGYRPLPEEDREIRFWLMLGGCFWNTSTVYRTDLVRAAGGYDPLFVEGAEDYDLWARLLSRAKCANITQCLVSARVHAHSYTAGLTKVLRNQSLVARRLIGAYLEREVTADEAHAVLSLLTYGWRTPMTESDVASALALVTELSARANSRESRDTCLALETRAARAMMQQARLQMAASRRRGLGLAMRAVRWDPRLLASRTTAEAVVASVVPMRHVRALGRARRWFASR